MKRYRNKSPQEVMRLVTVEIIERAIRYGRKTGRQICISKTSGGRGVEVERLDPKTPEGREQLEAFLKPIKRQYTISGLGAAHEPRAVHWRALNLPLGRRVLLAVQLALSLILKGTPLKNRLLRWMGVHVGQGVEVMQLVWLDHFRPELIFIGDNTLIGAFTRITVHGYEGGGRFRYGLVEIGEDCKLGAGTGVGPIRIGNRVRTLPGATLSPHFARIRDDSVVSSERPQVTKVESEARADRALAPPRSGSLAERQEDTP